MALNQIYVFSRADPTALAGKKGLTIFYAKAVVDGCIFAEFRELEICTFGLKIIRPLRYVLIIISQRIVTFEKKCYKRSVIYSTGG